jgi:hypothetical protein
MTYSTGPFSVDQVGFIQIATAEVLAAVAQGKLDLNRLAIEELAGRGMNHQGNWVGFEAAKKLLDGYEPRALTPDRPEESGSDYILADGHRGCWITIGNISVHMFRSVGDDRVEVELFAKGNEMDAPADTATMFFEDAGPVEPAPVEIPKTARDWLLYDMEGAEDAAKQMTSLLTKLLDGGDDQLFVRERMLELMDEHRKLGASDTVVRELLDRVLDNHFDVAAPTPRRPRG